MTLSRQLIMLVATLVVLLFLGTLAISVHNTRDYLESQLGSHAQDAATSLGLSATSHVAKQDRAMVTSMVNAMFHRGDYLSIRFEDLQGQALIERVTDLRVEGVPDWFVRALTLEAPQRSATMMSGWRQVGRVLVVSHPGLAYRKLWQTAVQTTRLFLIGALLVLLGGLVGLRILLRPLKEVEWQAEAICNREFPVVERQPFTLEFRRVVEAMNRLSSKVARMLSDSEQMAGRLRQQAFQDPVTGLANRRQFMDVLEHRVAEPDVFESGGLLLLQLKDLKGFNQTHGYAEGDRLLADAGKAIASVVDDLPRATLAHLSGADFAILLEGIGEHRLRDLAGMIVGAVGALYGRSEIPSSDVAHVGGVPYEGQSASDLLSQADMALREAQREGANAWVVRRHREDSGKARSGSEWRGLIERAIHGHHFSLLRQAVVSCKDGELLHHEVFLRLRDPDKPDTDIAAAVFMPMVESTGLGALVDKAVVETVLTALEEGAYPGRVAVNLSVSSLQEHGLLDWFLDTLQQHRVAAGRLILELPEYGASANVEYLVGWIDRLSPLGVEFSLDHFGKGFSSFTYLRSIKAHYLKVDGSFVRNLDQQEDNQFFLRAIADIGHGLDMQVIAESVEAESVWHTLQGLGVDGGRGFWLGRPE
jgi:diguanylate cyclase (GGDEF)-like protein